MVSAANGFRPVTDHLLIGRERAVLARARRARRTWLA
jgi:hypothetical protein